MTDKKTNKEIRKSLQLAISQWSEENADDWATPIWWGEDTTKLMAKAAFSVIEALQDHEECARRERWYA